MNKINKLTLVFSILLISFSMFSQDFTKSIPAAELTDKYLPLIEGKRIAVVANQTSMIKNVHLVDSLISLKLDVRKIFCPEHGFRGIADAGAHINNEIDTKTNLPIISLYGDNKKPSVEQMAGIDLVIFDIQDVGARFYTYISTLHYVMEACAENKVQLLIFDRPNPNGFYVDGPVLEPDYKSFVGMHPVPIVHGMTMAEYACMVNEEFWLKDSVKCTLDYILCENYDHNSLYELPINPSPNLSTMNSIYLYPSLCLFEGTPISVGRGTDFPFQVIGHPALKDMPFQFTPKKKVGASSPIFQDEICYGKDFRKIGLDYMFKRKQINLEWIIEFYKYYPQKDKFFKDFFKKLAGNNILKEQIKQGLSEEEIRKTWHKDLSKFKEIRKKYLLYEDFE